MNKLIQFEDWICDVRNQIPLFIREMSVPSSPGRFKFSLSGDVIPEDKHWGLGQTTFVARILYIFGLLDDVKRRELSEYILSFKGRDGYIYDREIEIRSRLPRFVSAIKYLKPHLYFSHTSKFAETRQAYAALINLGRPVAPPRMLETFDGKSIQKFIHSLNWKNPWGAASQVNHLLFFVHFSALFNSDERKRVLDDIEDSLYVYKRVDGSFYLKGDAPDINLKIGAAMKILMGLALINRAGSWVSREIYDLAFQFSGYCDACELFNTNYVLYICSKHLIVNRDLLVSRVLLRADNLREHYWPVHGGFSFHPKRAGSVYYSALVSKGLPEPDMHGTAMLTWGVYILSAMLGIDRNNGLNEPIL